MRNDRRFQGPIPALCPRVLPATPILVRGLGLCLGFVLAICIVPGCQQARKQPTSANTLTRSPNEKIGPKQSSNVQIAFGRAAEDRGDFQEAVAAYTAALKQDSKRAEVLQRLAVVHDRMGKFQESSTYYARALAAAPGNPEIFCDKGYSLYLQRKFRDAEVCLRQAIALQPDLNRAHVNLGLVMARQGKSDESLTEFRKGGCSPAIAHQNLAFVMTTERRWPEAQNQYKLVLAADPQSEIARKRLNELSPLIAKLESSEVKIATDPKILKATYEKQAARTIPVAKVKK